MLSIIYDSAIIYRPWRSKSYTQNYKFKKKLCIDFTLIDWKISMSLRQ